VIALCQLSRDIGQRDDKRPQLSDIKESGQFENDADQVIFCHREGYWLQRQGPKADKTGQVTDKARLEWEADLQSTKNVMELVVRKNRHGRLGTAQVGFHDATGRFWQLRKPWDDVQEGDV
jgi:replicative DNA helicase